MPKKDVSRFMGEFVLLAYREARNSFTIPGIGRLMMFDRKARKGRNPQTWESITIPAPW